MNIDYYIGIDGGGTTWDAILCAPDYRVLAKASYGGLNLRSAPSMAAIAYKVQELIRDMAETGGMLPYHITLTVLAGAGAGDVKLREAVEDACGALMPTNPIKVITDAEAALEGAFSGGAGIILIAGTGSIAYGKDASGKIYRAGGCGYLLGDEGSGFWMGREAMRRCLEANYRGGEEKLADKICAKYEVESITEVVSLFYSAEKPAAKLAGIAPLIFEAAELGEKLSLKIVAQAGKFLAELAEEMANGMEISDKIDLCLVGGLAKREIFLEAVRERLEGERFHLMPPQNSPAVGAVILGRKLTGERK